MDFAPLACLSWALQPFLIPPASRMSSGPPLWFSAFCAAQSSCKWQELQQRPSKKDEATETNRETNHTPGHCSRLEKNLSHVALWKTRVAKNRRRQESLNRSDRHMVCRLDGATQQLHLACRLPINPQAQLRHTEGQRGAGDRSVWYNPALVPRPQLACQAMLKSNWI